MAGGLIRPADSVLDYGCGRGDDVRALSALGFDCVGWDPVFMPDQELRASNVVNFGYVLNVIEEPDERIGALRQAWSYCERALVVAARVDIQAKAETATEHADGVVTARGTFQKFYTQPELRDFIEDVLGQKSVAAGPGIFFVFRSEQDRQRYASSLVRGRTVIAHTFLKDALFDEHRGLLDPITDFFRERGRLPQVDEVQAPSQLEAAFGSFSKVLGVVRSRFDHDEWHKIEHERRSEVLVYLALERFGGRARFSDLPPETRYDIKAFFGSYTRACREADELLFSTGDLALVAESCSESTVGKLTPEALYLHRAGLNQLPPRLRVYEGCARVLLGDVEGADIIKLDRTRPKVSYLNYPEFDEVAHPRLAASVVVWLDTMKARLYDFSDRENRPILHRKETLVPSDYPGRERFARLTRQEDRRNLLSAPEIGNEEWLERPPFSERPDGGGSCSPENQTTGLFPKGLMGR